MSRHAVAIINADLCSLFYMLLVFLTWASSRSNIGMSRHAVAIINADLCSLFYMLLVFFNVDI